MQITEVRVRLVDSPKMRAVASITFDGCFVVHDIKVIDGQNGTFVAMPSRKMAENDFRDIARLLNQFTRDMTIADLFRDFTKVNLPPVKVTKIEPQKPKQEEVEEVGTPSENAAEKQKQTVREINQPKAHTLEDTFEEFWEKNQPNAKSVTVTVDGREIREQITHEKELDVLKTELKDRVRENIDLKKTISKMQQQHAAEVADLNDRIMEAEAEANTIRKSKDEILKDRVQYADALDNDSVAFEEILGMAVLLERSAKSMQEMSKMIQEKTEGQI